jgi:hypothetical protein
VRKLAVLISLFVVVAVLAGVGAAAARADTAVIPAGTPDPWTDPAHQGVLERFASNVASMIVGRPVAVRCEDQATWNALNPTDAANVAGFVNTPPHSTTTTVTHYRYVWRWHVVHGKRVRFRRKVSYTTVVTHADIFTRSATTLELSPQVCQPLQQFGEASSKPTKCQPGTPAPVPCFTAIPTTEFPGICEDTALTMCYATATDWSDDYFAAYDSYAQALLTLAHESIHLVQGTAGSTVPPNSLVESQAECSGLQWTARVAEQFGDTPDDAETIAEYFWLIGYPNEANNSDSYSLAHPYWSADCKPGGPLDIRPAGSTVWP